MAELIPGTLDVLILKSASLGREHGYGILLRIEQISRGGFLIDQGAIYPALHRLEHQGLLNSEWGVSENGRKAKFYTLTAAGRRRLRTATEDWNESASAMALVLGATAPEVL